MCWDIGSIHKNTNKIQKVLFLAYVKEKMAKKLEKTKGKQWKIVLGYWIYTRKYR